MVLQRIQSLYLLLSMIVMIVFSFFPVLTITSADGAVYTLGVLSSGVVGAELHPDFLLSVLTALVVVLTGITIFRYRNLKMQMQLCSMDVALTLTLALSVAVIAFTQKETGDVSLSYWYAAPWISVLLDILAHKGIKHDKKLLSDSERIR